MNKVLMQLILLLILFVSCSTKILHDPSSSTDVHMHVHEADPNEPDMQFDGARVLLAANSIGIKRAIIISNAYLKNMDADTARKKNYFVVLEAKKNPSLLAPACAVNPAMDWVFNEIKSCKREGVKVLKIHTMASGMDLRKDDDKIKLNKVLDAAYEANMTVLIHGHFPVKHRGNEAQELVSVLEKHPDVRIIVGHLLGREFDLLREMKHPKLFVELSVTPIWMKTPQQKQKLLTFMKIFGMKRFFFGSDWPVLHPAEMLMALKDLGLKEQEIDLIINKNPHRLDDLFN